MRDPILTISVAKHNEIMEDYVAREKVALAAVARLEERCEVLTDLNRINDEITQDIYQRFPEVKAWFEMLADFNSIAKKNS